MNFISIEEMNLVIKSEKPVVIEFWGSTCTACYKADYFLLTLEESYKTKFKIFKIDVEKNIQVLERFSVTKLPTFIVFQDGAEKTRIIGFKSEMELEKNIRKYI